MTQTTMVLKSVNLFPPYSKERFGRPCSVDEQVLSYIMLPYVHVLVKTTDSRPDILGYTWYTWVYLGSTSCVVQENEINSRFGWYYFSRNLCLFTISIDVSVTTMVLSRPVGLFVVVGLVELEVVVMVWGDMRMQLTMKDWYGSMKKNIF